MMAGAIVLLAAALRIYGIANRELWIDEANAIVISWQSLPDLIARLRLDSSPPLYYAGLHYWMLAFGAGDAATRSLSVLGGVLLTYFTYRFGRRWFGTEVGLMAAALLAVAPIQIFYSQTVRMYAWLPLLALLATAALAGAIQSARPWRLVAYAAATLAALYTHNFALHLLPAHALLVAASGALRRHPARWLACAIAIGLGYLPWLPILREQLANKSQYGWFEAHWKQNGPAGILLESIQSFTPGGTQPPFVRQTGLSQFAWLPVAVIALLVGLAVVRWLRGLSTSAGGSSIDAARPPAIGFVLIATLMPLASALLSSMLLTPNYVPGRTDQLVFPGFVLLVAIGLSVLRPRPLRCVVLAGLLVVALTTIRPIYRSPASYSDRDLARAIADRARPGDAVVTTSLTRATLEVYLRRAAAPVTIHSFPPETALHLGNQSDESLLSDPEKMKRTATELIDELSGSGRSRRVFAVLALTPVNQVLYDTLLAAHRPQVEIGQYHQAGMPYPLMLVQFDF